MVVDLCPYGLLDESIFLDSVPISGPPGIGNGPLDKGPVDGPDRPSYTEDGMPFSSGGRA